MSTDTTDLTPSEGQDLFGPKPVQAVLVDKAAAARSVATARVIMPNRTQIELRAMDLESLLAEGHRAARQQRPLERRIAPLVTRGKTVYC